MKDETKLRRIKELEKKLSKLPLGEEGARVFIRIMRLYQSMEGGRLGSRYAIKGDRPIGGIWKTWDAEKYREMVARLGGKARAQRLSPEEKHYIASMGGYTRAGNLDAKRRKEIAKAAARARWAKNGAKDATR